MADGRAVGGPMSDDPRGKSLLLLSKAPAADPNPRHAGDEAGRPTLVLTSDAT